MVKTQITKLSEIENFWNQESCGERYANGESELEFYTSESESRYTLEPYIIDFAQFDEFHRLDVLEIGVGMGSDHAKIAQSEPSSLTGVDLTTRAILHTKKRFSSLNLSSNLMTDNAENLSFDDECFDAVYSWGVLHHSPNTQQCINEVWRVLRPNGCAKIMIYYKYSLVGLMLWIKYGLLKFKPFISLNEIYAKYLESPGTKAYSISEAKKLCADFSQMNYTIQLCHGDLLEGDVGARHKGLLLSIAKLTYPRFLIKIINKIFPMGLFLLITLKK
mgnify:CR=1 FL=1|tara:strand:+ start:2162 stop:2989 length:828 start_codon:yes stop_codon:yes gene_type:complete